MAQSILYYPTINIQDGTWLRNALLYWDEISSIVPFDNYPNFSPEIRYLQECGIYKPVFPWELFLSEYMPTFMEKVITRLEKEKRNRGGVAYTRRMSEDRTVKMHRNKIHSNKVESKRLYAPALCTSVHGAKVPFDLVEYLKENQFLYHQDDDGWMEIDEKASWIYMRTFAEFIVRYCSEDMVIGTDQERNQKELYMRTGKRKNAACISVSLNHCLPQPSMDTSFEDILDFKYRHETELLEFRNKLREFEWALAKCESVEEVKFQTEQFKESWQRALKQTEKMFTRERIKFAMGTLSTLVGAPAIAESLDAAVQRIVPAEGISSALLYGTAAIGVGCKFISYKNKVNEKRSSAGFSYLMKASDSRIIKSF